MDRGLKAVLQMAGQSMHHSSDGSVAIVLGDCMMGTASAVGTYARFQNYLVKKLRQLTGVNMTDNFVHELKGMEKPLPFRRIAIQ